MAFYIPHLDNWPVPVTEKNRGDANPSLSSVSVLGGGRLSIHVSATFLAFFRTTTPQLSHNFRKSSSHRPRCGSKGQVLSTSFWRGLRFLRCFRQNPVFLGMGSASWRVQSAISQGIGTFWSLETQNFARPYKIVALGWSPARNFRRLSAFRDRTATFGKTFAKVWHPPTQGPARVFAEFLSLIHI